MAIELYRRLGITPGVTAVIGSGGKTSLIGALTRELPGRVIVCTTTHIYPAAGLPLLHRVEAPVPGACCVGTPAAEGKLTAPVQSMAQLAELADYVLVEADGARGLPLKAHLPQEPVLPPEAGRVIQVVGLSGMGRPIAAAAHRAQTYARLCGCGEQDIATPERVAQVLNTESLADCYVLNQADDREEEKWARTLGALLHRPVVVTCLKQER